jgi:hypothetical protein
VLSNTKEMSSTSLFDGGPGGNIMGNFVTLLARSWYMADGPPSHFDLGAQLDWLFLLLSDQNRVRAAGLYAAYNQCRAQITDDKPALETLEQQRYNLQCSVTPIHRLPAEIMTEIFYIALDVGQPRTGLMQVCQRWCSIIEGMSSLWASLDLGAGSTPESVHYWLSRAGTRPLAVKIDIDKGRSTAERLQPSLAVAGNKASRWQTLTIASLPQDEPDAQSNHALLSMQIQPMSQLRHLNITEPVLSPLLRALLQNISTAAVGELMSMKIHSFDAVEYLLQPAHSSIWRSLTTFIAEVSKKSEPVDLLPHFIQLEVLELTNLLLIVDYNSPLPLAHTLHHLYLKSVSIQWMGGRVFSQLENCTIIAPLADHPPLHDIQLPACTELHFENWNISPIGQFIAPALDHMRVKSNAWSPHRGNVQVVQFVRAGFGMGFQPKSLSLSVTCKDTVLLAVLQLLPELVELKLDLPRPSALGKRFFTGLLAKPGNEEADNLKFDWRELFRENGIGWRSAICPYLRVLELKYQQWLRPGCNDDFLPPLLALSWSREKTTAPLQLHIHYKSAMHSWRSLNSTPPQVKEVISCLRIPQSGQVNGLSLTTKTWKNAIVGNDLVTPFLRRLKVLKITGSGSAGKRQVLNALPSFHELRDLELSRVHVPPPLDVGLPLVHTLRKLSLRKSTLAWMDGLVFTQLQRFEVDERGWPDTFKRKVGMPACTHIVFEQDKLKTLPVLQSNFHFPLLNTCEFPEQWNHSEYDKRGVSAFQRIHAKAFKFTLFRDHQGLLKLLEFKDEVEQLDLVLLHALSPSVTRLPAIAIEQQILSGLSLVNHITMKLPCPNMKWLRLWIRDSRSHSEQFIQPCLQMMDNRRLAGYSLNECYIWLHKGNWEKALVLVMENETVRIER